MKNQKAWTIGIIALVVIAIVAGYLVMNKEIEVPVTPAPEAPTGPQTLNVDISNMALNPTDLTIKVGDTVVWTNNDDATHLITGTNGVISSKTMKKGDTYSKTFDKAGTYSYMCQIHPSMKGKIIVE